MRIKIVEIKKLAGEVEKLVVIKDTHFYTQCAIKSDVVFGGFSTFAYVANASYKAVEFCPSKGEFTLSDNFYVVEKSFN